MMFLKRLLRMPFTIALVAVLLGVALATGPIGGPSAFLRGVVGLDFQTIALHKWWSFVTAQFFAANLGQLIVVLVAAAIGVGVAELVMGSRRTIVAFLLTGVLGSGIGVGVQALGVFAGEYWATSVRSLVTIDPLTPVIGTIAVASAYASVLWRRRIRTVVLASTIAFLLYSGQPSDLYRVLAMFLGFGIGAIWTRQRIRLVRWTSSHHETRLLLATVAAVFATGPILTLVSHGTFGLLAPLGVFITDGMSESRLGRSPCSVAGVGQACVAQLGHHGGGGVSALVLALVPLLVLLVGAYGLLNGRRAAVYLVASISAANGLLAAFYFGVVPVFGQPSGTAVRAGQSPEFAVWIIANAALPLAFAAVVLSQRRHFPIHAVTRARRRFVATVGISLLTTAGAYLGLGFALRDQFRPSVGFLDLLADLPERFIPVSFLTAERRDFVPVTMLARIVYHGVGPVFWLVLLVAAIVFLRGQRSTGRALGDGAAIRRLLRVGGGSMSFPATWDGNRYWFDSDRSMVVAYRIANGCAVTTSEPIGHPSDVRESLGQFIRFCDANAWTPVFYGIHGEWADRLVELGWSKTVIAEETVIDPSIWEMTGKKWQDVRSSVNRAAREGVRVTWGSWSTLPSGVANQIAEISELWVVEKKLPELGFTLGGVDELRDPDVLLAVAIDETGSVQAVTSWLPTWRDGDLIGYTLDFMRRRANGMNGVMEFVIAEAAVRAKLDGLEFLSLSGAPLAVVSSDDEDVSPLDRILMMIGRSLEPVYGFRSLLAFKQKFQPKLVSLYLAYPDAMSLPAIGIAVSRCYLPTLTLRESAVLLRSLR